MKKLILFSFFLLVASVGYSQDGFMRFESVSAVSQTIDNGNYTATVSYYNQKTYTKATYSLTVTVSNDRVIAIYFGNGGSIHTGQNNENYSYSGGRLTFAKDYKGNITGASAIVEITDASNPYSAKQYYIQI